MLCLRLIVGGNPVVPTLLRFSAFFSDAILQRIRCAEAQQRDDL